MNEFYCGMHGVKNHSVFSFVHPILSFECHTYELQKLKQQFRDMSNVLWLYLNPLTSEEKRKGWGFLETHKYLNVFDLIDCAFLQQQV